VLVLCFFFFQAEDGIRDFHVTGVQTCALPIYQHNSGFLPHERQWLSQLFNQLGYVDAFRRVNRDPDEYSWWPSGTKDEGEGWRTDFQVVSSSIGGRVEYATIYKVQQFSSHLPVIIDYDIEWER